MALVCTLSCCAMTAELKSSSLSKTNGKPCLKTRLYSQTVVIILAGLCFNSSHHLAAFNTHNSCPLDFSTQIPRTVVVWRFGVSSPSKFSILLAWSRYSKPTFLVILCPSSYSLEDFHCRERRAVSIFAKVPC